MCQEVIEGYSWWRRQTSKWKSQWGWYRIKEWHQWGGGSLRGEGDTSLSSCSSCPDVAVIRLPFPTSHCSSPGESSDLIWFLHSGGKTGHSHLSYPFYLCWEGVAYGEQDFCLLSRRLALVHAAYGWVDISGQLRGLTGSHNNISPQLRLYQ